jgi:hypothetical protein
MSAVSGCLAGSSLTDASPMLEPSICKGWRLGCPRVLRKDGRDAARYSPTSPALLLARAGT